MMHKDHKRIRLLVRGRVQGVGFRWFVAAEARRLGLSGWVRNHADGSVELEAEGAPADLEMIRARAAKGPPAARVDAVVELAPGAAELPVRFASR